MAASTEPLPPESIPVATQIPVPDMALDVPGISPILANRQYVRLEKLRIQGLPMHPSLAKHQNIQQKEHHELPSAKALAYRIRREAAEFLLLYHSSNKKKSPKKSKPYSGEVHLSTKLLQPEALPPARTGNSSKREPEFWAGRSSRHAEKPAEENPRWEEFENALFHDRNKKEVMYTPDVLDAKEICNWDNELDDDDGKMGVWEMYHKLPFPCAKRRFTVLVVTTRVPVAELMYIGDPTPVAAFVTVKIPVEDVSGLPSGYVCGHYVSIEIVKRYAVDGIQWDMITTSDAGGSIPALTQRMAIPGEIAKDVGMVCGWITRERKKSATDGHVGSTN